MTTDEYIDPNGRPRMGNARCCQGHPLWLVAEGYGYCYGRGSYGMGYWAWRLAPPVKGWWNETHLWDGSTAWQMEARRTLQGVLKDIEDDIRAHRSQPVQHSEGPTYAEWLAGVTA